MNVIKINQGKLYLRWLYTNSRFDNGLSVIKFGFVIGSLISSIYASRFLAALCGSFIAGVDLWRSVTILVWNRRYCRRDYHLASG